MKFINPRHLIAESTVWYKFCILRFMKKTILLVLGILLTSFAGFGQRNYLGLNIKVYDPLSNMGENIGALPVGLSFSYLHAFERNKFSVGAELGVAMYSSNDYDLNYQGLNISVNEEDCFWTLHGVVSL